MGPGVGSADADVVEAAAVAQGDGAVGVEAVGADAVVGVAAAVAGGGFGPGGVGGGGGAPVGQGPVRPLVVVDGGERADPLANFAQRAVMVTGDHRAEGSGPGSGSRGVSYHDDEEDRRGPLQSRFRSCGRVANHRFPGV